MNTIADLQFDVRNARKHPKRNTDMMAQSLQEVGAARSIVIDENNVILAGNGIVESAGQVGIENVQIVDVDGDTLVAVRRSGLTAKQKTRLALWDNRAAETAEWDTDVLAELLDTGDLDGMFYDNELDELLNSLTEPISGLLETADPDAIPEHVETRCKSGDLWQLGRHRLLCGDSTSTTDVEKLMGDELPAMVWADPPYGIDIVAANVTVGGGEAYDIPFGGKKVKGDVGGSTSHMRKTGKPYIADKKGLGTVGGSKPFGSKDVRGSIGAANMIDVGKYAPIIGDDTTDTATDAYMLYGTLFATAVHIWWGGNYYADKLPPSSCWIVWDKENTGNFADAELAWTNQKTAVRIFKHMWNGLMKASERGERRVHPTQKPVALAEWAFEKYGAEGDIILDPFLGSGMSIIAAEKTNRSVYGIEMSADYCDVILTRWENATGKTATLITE